MYYRLTDGRRICYELLGDVQSPTICFTHSLSADSGMWADQVPDLLTRGYQVLRIDTRGHGGSDSVPGGYTLDELADDVAVVLRGLRVAPVDYVGLSIGGMFGQAFALRHPRLLRSLVLCDTLVASIPGSESMWQERMATARAAGSLQPLALGTMDRWFTPEFKTRRPLRYQQVLESVIATSVDGFVGCSAAMQGFDFSRDLHRVAAPTLVICGADDPGTPPAENRRLAGLIPGARYEEIAGCRHLPNVEAPAAFNELLLGWLERER